MTIILSTTSTGSTYSTLKADIASELNRTDLTDKIPGFISRAESYLFRELQVKERQVSVTGTTVGEYADLPTDYGSISKVSVSYAGSARTLDYMARPSVSTYTDVYPKYFSLENGKLRIYNAGDGQAYTLYYIPKIEALSDTITTNWLLENAPDLYLYASTLEGAKHVRNPVLTDSMTNSTALALDSVKRFAERRGEPATGSMQIKVRRG
jgi:hypothetical protein